MGISDQYEDSGERSFMARYGFAIGGCGVAIIVVVMLSQVFSGHGSAPPLRKQEMVMVKTVTPPPPPPPPPTPPPQTEPKQQMVEQTPENEEKPVEEPVDQSPALGSNIQGNGPPDAFGLRGHNNGFLGGGGGGRSGGSRFGWYASEVIGTVGDALRQNPHTRGANFNLKVRIWSDDTGRVVRVKLAGTTGDPAVDDAIQNEILKGLQLKEPPPDGMPMPIVMRLSAKRPN
jgi:protein TonB